MGWHPLLLMPEMLISNFFEHQLSEERDGHGRASECENA
jgi:hypothetical protein